MEVGLQGSALQFERKLDATKKSIKQIMTKASKRAVAGSYAIEKNHNYPYHYPILYYNHFSPPTFTFLALIFFIIIFFLILLMFTLSCTPPYMCGKGVHQAVVRLVRHMKP